MGAERRAERVSSSGLKMVYGAAGDGCGLAALEIRKFSP